MRPYATEENDRLNRPGPEAGIDRPAALDWDEIEHYLRLGRQLHAEAMGQMLRSMASGLRRGVARVFSWLGSKPAADDEFLSAVADGLRSPLTAIRAMAEILRDNPDLPLDQRKHLLELVIAEDERLTQLIGKILDASEFTPATRRWQIRAKSLEKTLPCSV